MENHSAVRSAHAKMPGSSGSEENLSKYVVIRFFSSEAATPRCALGEQSALPPMIGATDLLAGRTAVMAVLCVHFAGRRPAPRAAAVLFHSHQSQVLSTMCREAVQWHPMWVLCFTFSIGLALVGFLGTLRCAERVQCCRWSQGVMLFGVCLYRSTRLQSASFAAHCVTVARRFFCVVTAAALASCLDPKWASSRAQQFQGCFAAPLEYQRGTPLVVLCARVSCPEACSMQARVCSRFCQPSPGLAVSLCFWASALARTLRASSGWRRAEQRLLPQKF